MKELIGDYVIQQIQELYKESDYEMLKFINTICWGLDLELDILIENAIKSNEEELDTPQYYEKRNKLLHKLGFIFDYDNNELIYVGDII